jgi:hypothetical protein
VDLLFGEPGLKQPIGEQRESIFDRRVERLPEVAGQDRVLRSDRANVIEEQIPGNLAGVRGGEAALEKGAPVCEIALGVHIELL